MSVPPPTVVPLDPADSARAAAVLGRAFQDDPLMVYLEPDARRRARVVPICMRGGQDYCLAYGRVTTTPDLAGVACWLPPGATDLTFRRMLRTGMVARSLPLGLGGLRRLQGMVGAADRCHHRAMPEPHWYLWMLGTEPDRVGRGVGGALLAPTLAEADAGGHPVYLETHLERNLAYYARHGFAPVAEETHAGVRFWGMRRDPR